MADFKENNNRNNNEKSTMAVIMEIMKLLGLLCLKLLKRLGMFVLKCLKFILKWTIKGLIFVIDAIDKGWNKLKQFWNDNNTQEKKRKILNGLKKGCVNAIKGIGISLLFLLKALVWLFKKFFIAILHLKSTFKICGEWITNTAAKVWKWSKNRVRKTKDFFKKIKYNYKSFRRNQGFKGLLFDLRNGLKKTITQYIENEQDDDEDTEEEIETVEIVTDTEFDEDDTNVSGIRKMGRRIYKAMKNISDIK